MGIDGGGSNLRVAITRDDLTIISYVNGETTNPSIIGRELAAERIRAAVGASLEQTNLVAGNISGIGVGIAGASVTHSEPWLHEVFSNAVPGVPLVLSSDVEIALIGAHGKRQGVLVLAGTGSIAYGVNSAGLAFRAGGWGYLMGDEGGSYWMGARALQTLTHIFDGREAPSPTFVASILNALRLQAEEDVLPWLYHSGQPRNREVAQLASVVLELASNNISNAQNIVEAAANELASLCRAVIEHLRIQNPRIAFAGGLLEHTNPLSERLDTLLAPYEKQTSLYSPVIGAVLLAQSRL